MDRRGDLQAGGIGDGATRARSRSPGRVLVDQTSYTGTITAIPQTTGSTGENSAESTDETTTLPLGESTATDYAPVKIGNQKEYEKYC